MASERSEIVLRMARAISTALDEPWEDEDTIHLPHLRAADAALREIEKPVDTKAQVIKPCTCGHNGYGKHLVGCELYGNQ